MHFYAFTMHNSADTEGDKLALLDMARENWPGGKGLLQSTDPYKGDTILFSHACGIGHHKNGEEFTIAALMGQ